MNNNFAIRLSELRKEKGYSQRSLSKKIGISQPTICQYEKSEREPDLNTVIQIALFFEVSTDYLLGLEREDGSKIQINNSFNGSNINGNFQIGGKSNDKINYNNKKGTN